MTLCALGVYSFATTDVKFRGMTDTRVLDLVLQRARWHVFKEGLLILATLVVVGALLGTLGMFSGRAWDWARQRQPTRYTPALRGLAFALVGHALLLARSIIHYPQLYAAHYDYKGSVRRALMRALTDTVPLRAMDMIIVAALAAVVLRPFVYARARAWALAQIKRRPAVASAIVGAPIVVIALLVLVGGGARAHHARGKPNVLWIAVDSLRADRVFDGRRFPTIAKLAARGTRFREAYVSQARTFPAFTSMLTGRWPQHHGIRHELPSVSARTSIDPTLVSVLNDAGYRTAAVSDFSGDIFNRATFGFSSVDVPRFDLYSIITQQMLSSQPHVLPYASSALGRRIFPAIGALAEFDDPELLADRAIDELDELADGDKPFFMVVFFSAPHSPYMAPYPYYRSFSDPTYDGMFRYLKQPLPAVPDLSPDDARQVRALYDGAVLAVDDGIARLLEALERDGVADNTIIILLGDHGDNLFDGRGRGMGHGDHLWGPHDTHIPIVIVDPTRRAPSDVTAIVRDVDLAPTLAARLGVQLRVPPDGVDLAPLIDHQQESLELDAYSETGLWFLRSGPGYHRNERLPYPDVWEAGDVEPTGALSLKPQWEARVVEAKYRALRTPQWKLVYQPAPDGAHWRLFDLVHDPQELADVADEHPAEVAQLRAKLEAWIVSDGHTRIQPEAP